MSEGFETVGHVKPIGANFDHMKKKLFSTYGQGTLATENTHTQYSG